MDMFTSADPRNCVRRRPPRITAVLRALAVVAIVVAILVSLEASPPGGRALLHPQVPALNLFVASANGRTAVQLAGDELTTADCTSRHVRLATRALPMSWNGEPRTHGVEVALTLPDGFVRRAYELLPADDRAASLRLTLTDPASGAPERATYRSLTGFVRLDLAGRGWFEAVLADGLGNEMLIGGNWACEGAPSP